MSCRVTLLSHTPAPDELVAAAARLCYRDVTAADLLEGEARELSAELIEHLRRSGHLSTFEHASFTFAVDGLSRVASPQLVRHRLASFSQQSQRYVRMDRPAVVLPPSVAAIPEAAELFRAQAEASHQAYEELVALGVPQEDARFILPHGWETRLVLTMNARELHHFFRLRLCRRAQWEIRELARQMLAMCRREAPTLFRVAGPSCIFGPCGEARPCGQPYSNVEDVLRDEWGSQEKNLPQSAFQPLKPQFGGPELGRFYTILPDGGREGANILVRMRKGSPPKREGPLRGATFTLGGRVVTPYALDKRIARVAHVQSYRLEQTGPREYRICVLRVPEGDGLSIKGGILDALVDVYGGKGCFDIEIVSDAARLAKWPEEDGSNARSTFPVDWDSLFQ